MDPEAKAKAEAIRSTNEPAIQKFKKAFAEQKDEDKIASLSEFDVSADIGRYQTSEAILKEILEDIQIQIQRQNNALLEAYFNFIAELAKLLSNRKKLGELKFPEITMSLLEKGEKNVQVALLRAFANTVAESDENCQTFQELGFLEKAILLLQQHDETLAKNTAAVLANLIQGEDEMQKQLIAQGAMKILMNRLDTSKTPEVLKLTSFAILGMLEVEEGIKEFLELKGLEKILELARASDLEIQMLSLKALSTLAEEEKLKRELFLHKCFDFLLETVNSSSAPLEHKQIAAKAIPHLLIDDENMTDLFDSGHLEGFKDWLDHDDVIIRAYAALCISNLARTDDHCIRMVKSGIAPSMVNILKREDPKEKQGALAALRNLSLAPENKTTMGESGLIEEISQILIGDNLALKFNAIIVLKIVATGHEENARKAVALGILPKLKDIVANTSHDGVQCESARVFVQIANSKKDDLLETLVQEKAFSMIKILLESKHDILKNEGLNTLSLFTHLQAHHAELVSESIEGLSSIIAGQNADLQEKALSFLKKIVHSETQAILRDSKLSAELQNFATSGNDSIKQQVNQLLQ